MDAHTETTLAAVYDGIVEHIKAAFPAFAHVEAEREDRTKPPLPACLVELAELPGAPEDDPGTGQLAVMASFEAFVLVGFRQPSGKSAKREAAELAGQLAAFARLQRWGCDIGPAEVAGAWKDDFTSDRDEYEVWRVEWQQIINLGGSVWESDATTPTDPMLGFAPLIGPGREDDYVPIADPVVLP